MKSCLIQGSLFHLLSDRGVTTLQNHGFIHTSLGYILAFKGLENDHYLTLQRYKGTTQMEFQILIEGLI